MSRLRIKKPRKPGRSCLFCGGTGMSGEHIWPDWASSYFAKTPHDSRNILFKTSILKGRMSSPTEITKRHGHPTTAKLKVVCRRCNNGWMSAIEDDTKPALEPLIEGLATTITPTQREQLARWVSLKLMVTDQTRETETAFTSEMCAEFKANQSPVPGLRLWLASCGVGRWQHGLELHTASIYSGPISPDLRPRKNMKSMAMGFGDLLIYATYFGDQKAHDGLILKFKPCVVPIWPSTGDSIGWPPERRVTAREADEIAAATDGMFRLKSFVWSPDPKSGIYIR